MDVALNVRLCNVELSTHLSNKLRSSHGAHEGKVSKGIFFPNEGFNVVPTECTMIHLFQELRYILGFR